MKDIYIDFDYKETREAGNGSIERRHENIMYMAKGKLFRTRKRNFDLSPSDRVNKDWEFSVDGKTKFSYNRRGLDGQVKSSLPEEGDIKQSWVVHYLPFTLRMPRNPPNKGHSGDLIGLLQECGHRIEVSEGTYEGRKAVILTQPGYSRIYLDPKLNFAVLGSEATGRYHYKWINSNFSEVAEGIWMPLQILHTTKKGSTRETRRVKVNKLTVNNDFTEDDFRIRYGPGASVLDVDLGKHVTPPAAKLDRSVLNELLDMVEGRDFTDIRSQENKALLVCFWDMEQRPSRGVVENLASRADELQKMRVAVVLAHASGVDVGKLKNWLDNRKIPFTCGIIKNHTEKIRLRWGVHAQPWLILADERGVVRAEGFTLEQLDEKLDQKEQPNS